jgi:glycine cleavage system aminomethyltransferase T/glycine/D-amino acid oxidase-like deaminating enzyme
VDRRIVIVGAGVVGVGLADELAALGARDVTVVDRGPRFATGGSTYHAPGLVSRTSTSKFLSDTAAVTIEKFRSLATDEGPAFPGLGTLEVAYNEARLQELRRRCDAALSFGWRGRIVDPDEALAMWPIIERDGLLGGYATEDEGLAAAVRAVEAMGARAADAGVRFVDDTAVGGFLTGDGRVSGVRLAGGDVVEADVVVCCAGVWTPVLASTVGITLPVVPMEHQYAVTTAIPALAANADRWATLPIIRHHDIGIYFRDHGAAVGIGSFHHRGLPVAPEAIDAHARNIDGNLAFAWTEEDWEDAWKLVVDFMPPLRDAGLARRFNGIFGFTPDGFPVVGEHPDVRGLWFAASIWITHSQGVARMLAETLVHGGSAMDPSPADLSRFDERELDASFVLARTDDQYRDVYVAHHPAEPATSARGIRYSPFAERQRELGAEFVNVATWERPQWYEANASLARDLPALDRDAWSRRHWSPIVVAEHLATRERVGLFDMTPLFRIEVTGPGGAAFLDRAVAGRTDGPVGSVVYTLLLDARGGIRSDVTVARLDEERWWIGGNGPRDLAWLRALVPDGGSVALRPIWDEVASVGLWGPRARDVASAVTDDDLSQDGFLPMTARTVSLAGVEVTAMRVSYAGEAGWEFTSAAEDGPTLWDALWSAGERHGIVAAGRGALGSLRLEKGYRAWGSDLTPEHGAAASGLAWTVRRDGSPFLGADGPLAHDDEPRRLRMLVLDGEQVAMGSEPVLAGGAPIGYVTSAAWGPSVGQSLALAWVDAGIGPDDPLAVRCFGRDIAARIGPDRPFDPTGERLRA